ncbi:MAG: hypothetical protein AAB393_06215 [Bacteroidota bacterium]
MKWPWQLPKGRGLLVLATVLSACKFESDIEPLRFPTAPPQPSFGVVPEAGDTFESREEAVSRLLDDLFDPFYLGGGITYEGSVFQQMDRILAGAYSYYGYDLAGLAARRQNNPITEQMFFNYLAGKGRATIKDPSTGEELGTYEWLQRSVLKNRGGHLPLVLEGIEGLDADYIMNYESNYLAALTAARPAETTVARIEFRAELREVFGEDAAAIYAYLETLDLFGGE